MKRALLTMCMLAGAILTSFANVKVKEVTGSYTYYIPYNVARDKAEQIALERAMLQALEQEFGTILSQATRMDMRSSKEGENVDFWSSAQSLVKGEWIETIGTPKFEPFIEDGGFAIRCEVRGKAREINRARADLDVKVLRNGTADTDETSTFLSGEKCYLAFTTPVKGFLAVYLEDEQKNMNVMLPYYSQSITCTPVAPGIRHVFFTSSDGDKEQYVMQTDKEVERNIIYVVFSQNKFVKPIDKSTGKELSLKTLSSDDFHRWVNKARALDDTFQLVTLPVTITSKIE